MASHDSAADHPHPTTPPRDASPGAAPGARLGARLESLAEDLALIVGPTEVITDRDVARSFTVDWTGRYGGKRALVVRPGSTDEVARCVEAAAAHGVAIVPQGGNTGLVGGSVPNRHDCLVISTTRLTTISDLDDRTGQLTVGAGVRLADLATFLRTSHAAARWRFGVDIGARDSATIGGMVATNAGGSRVMRFGSMRSHVAGLEYVSADGRVGSHLGGLLKDNTGYELAGLLCGSEGTLGIITSVRLRLIPERTHRISALCAFDDLDDAVSFAWQLRASCDAVEAIEYIDAACADLVGMMNQVDQPVRGAALILIEATGNTDPLDDVAAAIGRIQPAPTDVAFGLDAPRSAALWRLRDDITATLSRLGEVHKYDISIPARSLDHVRRRIESSLATSAPRATAWWFGHVCDDNVHLNVTGPGLDGAPLDGTQLDELVMRVVIDAHGSISAEHGIGVHKAPYLAHARSPLELEHMRAIKQALDPQELLNPGVIFPSR